MPFLTTVNRKIPWNWIRSIKIIEYFINLSCKGRLYRIFLVHLFRHKRWPFVPLLSLIHLTVTWFNCSKLMGNEPEIVLFSNLDKTGSSLGRCGGRRKFVNCNYFVKFPLWATLCLDVQAALDIVDQCFLTLSSYGHRNLITPNVNSSEQTLPGSWKMFAIQQVLVQPSRSQGRMKRGGPGVRLATSRPVKKEENNPLIKSRRDERGVPIRVL